MPEIRRNVSGRELVQRLARLDYFVVRQTGSHIRLGCSIVGKVHRLTIPDHDSLKIGTLSGILADIAEFHGIEKIAATVRIFGD